jgi:hypothetical protein
VRGSPFVLATALAVVAAGCASAVPEIHAETDGQVAAEVVLCDDLRPPPGPVGEDAYGPPESFVAAAERYARHQPRETYGGLWIGFDDRQVTLSFTEDVEGHQRRLDDELGEGRVRVVLASLSVQDLDELFEEITAREFGPAGEEGSVVGAGVMADLGRIAVTILGDHADAWQRLTDRYPPQHLCLDPLPIPDIDDAVVATWEPANADSLGPATTEIDILVMERSCASGRPAAGRIAPPDIELRDDAVVVTIKVIPAPGIQDCPGNPPTPFTIKIGEPLGERVLLDGGTGPPTTPFMDR